MVLNNLQVQVPNKDLYWTVDDYSSNAGLLLPCAALVFTVLAGVFGEIRLGEGTILEI